MSLILEDLKYAVHCFFGPMFFYYELLIVLVVLGFLLVKKSKLKYKNEIYMGAVFLILFCLSAFRYDVGFDYFHGYIPIWRNVLETPFSNWKSIGVEPGYTMLNYFTRIFTDHFQGIFIVTSFIIVGLMCLFIYKYFPDKVWGVFMIYGLGLFFDTMCVLRQGIALFLVVFAIMFARKKQIIPYMLLVLLASTFHKSALVMIPIYFILQIKLSKKLLGAYLGITLILFTFSNQFLDIATKYIFPKYRGYLSSIYVVEGAEIYYVIPIVIYFSIIYFYRDKILKGNENNNVLLNCVFIDMFLYLISLKHMAVARLCFYFDPITALTLVILINELRKDKEENREDKKKKRVYIAITSFLAVFMISFNIRQLYYDSTRVVPYQTIFGNEEYQRYCQAVEENDMDYIMHYESQE